MIVETYSSYITLRKTKKETKGSNNLDGKIGFIIESLMNDMF